MSDFVTLLRHNTTKRLPTPDLVVGWLMLIRILNWGSCGSEIVNCGLVVHVAMYQFIIHKSLVKLELNSLYDKFFKISFNSKNTL